jgi:y4mF family transcriptional regulator
MNEIGKQIRDRRKVLGITQEVLAEISGVGIRTIYDIENGKGNPSFNTLSELLEVLGMEVTLTVRK